jgi:hypothetical protein
MDYNKKNYYALKSTMVIFLSLSTTSMCLMNQNSLLHQLHIEVVMIRFTTTSAISSYQAITIKQYKGKRLSWFPFARPWERD